MSLASEVQDLHLAQRKDMASGFSKGPSLGLLPDVPSLTETLSYSYCYVGIMTGECAFPPSLPVLSPSPSVSIPASAAWRVSFCARPTHWTQGSSTGSPTVLSLSNALELIGSKRR